MNGDLQTLSRPNGRRMRGYCPLFSSSLLIIPGNLRCRFSHLHLVAHLVKTSSESFNLLLLLGDQRTLFLDLAVRFEKLVQQHRVHRGRWLHRVVRSVWSSVQRLLRSRCCARTKRNLSLNKFENLMSSHDVLSARSKRGQTTWQTK